MFDIAKKKKDEGIYLIGQNANDVTGSCIYIKYNGKKILLECGLYQNNNYLESYNINSAKFQFKPSEIDYVFIGHTHVDHIGLLPRLVKEGFTGKIIASHATAQLMKPLLYNCAFILLSEANALSFKYKRNYSPIYDETDVTDTLKYIVEYDEIHTQYVLVMSSHLNGMKIVIALVPDSSNLHFGIKTESQNLFYTLLILVL